MKNEKSDTLSVVVLAAGNSTRMNSENTGNTPYINKQFINIGDVPVIIHTLKCFESLEAVTEILVVTLGKEIAAMKSVIAEYGITKVIDVIEGGSIRQKSAYKALKYGLKGDYVAIHDGARPFVESDMIEDTFKNAVKFKAAAPAVEVKDTLKEVDENGFVISTPDRSVYRQIQTPQIFERSLILKAHEIAENEGYIGTDDCSLVEHIGEKVILTKGDYNNIKVTTREDIPIAEIIYKTKHSI